jgi:tRNA-binding protein
LFCKINSRTQKNGYRISGNNYKINRFVVKQIENNMDLTWNEFERTDMRVGTIIEVNDFPEARKPAYQLTIDFGAEIGIRKSSAQITTHYKKENLVNRQVISVVNFPRKQIGKFMSECLVLGAIGKEGDVILLAPDFKIENGLRIG